MSISGNFSWVPGFSATIDVLNPNQKIVNLKQDLQLVKNQGDDATKCSTKIPGSLHHGEPVQTCTLGNFTNAISTLKRSICALGENQGLTPWIGELLSSGGGLPGPQLMTKGLAPWAGELGLKPTGTGTLGWG
jgi:hypothetical protein